MNRKNLVATRKTPVWVTATGSTKTRIKKAAHYLKRLAWVPTSARDGDRAMLVVVCNLRRYHRLCAATTVTLIREHYNPRCLTSDGTSWAWSEQDILKKYRQAGKRGMYPTLGVSEPPRLLNALRLIGKDKNAFVLNAVNFYVEAFKASPDAAKWVMGRLKNEDRGPRLFGFLVLKEAGIDISKALAELSEEDRKSFAMITGGGSILPDPYDLNIRVDDPVQPSSKLDMLWSVFIATGSAKPLRAIASTLMWRDDWKVYLKIKEDFQKTGKGPSSMTPELIRASTYAVAGWSLGSFYRTHGLATDYIEAMKADPMVPEMVKEELRGLIGNPAFKMDK